ncbi:MAG: TadE/TadG family type IV pilus assembly protein [Dehalococcoidia bacterium]|nr:TadE/TadG family type IV pilus assembly protein [Dehalococcoidia bacterium]
MRRGEAGQAQVEFALVGLVFLILVFGMIDVGRAVWNYNTLAEATREGTRYAIVHGARASDPSGPGDDAAVQAQVQQFAAGLDLSQLTVSVDFPDGNNNLGDEVTVTSEYDYDPLFGFFGAVSIPMTSSSTMTVTN